MIEEKKQVVQRNISAALDNAQSGEELKNVVEYTYSQEMEKVLEEVNSALRTQVKKLNRIGKKQLRVFESEFKELYESLATLGGKVTVDKLVLGQNTLVLEGNSVAIQVAHEMKEMENWSKGGGSLLGALLGTLIFPGIGTVIGGSFGRFLGQAFSEGQFNESRIKCRDELQKGLEQNFLEMQSTVNKSLKDAIEQLIRDLERIIQRYFQQYDRLVRDMIARDQAEAAQLKQIRASIQSDLSSLTERQQQLARSRKKLSEF